MENKVKILMKEFLTHDMLRFVVEKPEGYEFTPGQASLVSIPDGKFENEKRPFTFVSLNEDLVLEFNIKIYSSDEHGGFTKKLSELNSGDELILREPFGAINYFGEGVFIAGGAGVTPFIAILRDLKQKGEIKNNRLIFSNKTNRDILLEKEFREMFSKENLILTLTRDVEKESITQEYPENRYYYERIDKDFLESHIKNFEQKFYVCGPPKFVDDVVNYLKELEVKEENIVIENL